MSLVAFLDIWSSPRLSSWPSYVFLLACFLSENFFFDDFFAENILHHAFTEPGNILIEPLHKACKSYSYVPSIVSRYFVKPKLLNSHKNIQD